MGQAEDNSADPPVGPEWQVGRHPSHRLRALLKGRWVRADSSRGKGHGFHTHSTGLCFSLWVVLPFPGASFSQPASHLYQVWGPKASFQCVLCAFQPKLFMFLPLQFSVRLCGLVPLGKKNTLSCHRSPAEDRVVLSFKPLRKATIKDSHASVIGFSRPVKFSLTRPSESYMSGFQTTRELSSNVPKLIWNFHTKR